MQLSGVHKAGQENEDQTKEEEDDLVAMGFFSRRVPK